MKNMKHFEDFINFETEEEKLLRKQKEVRGLREKKIKRIFNGRKRRQKNTI
jgi:hypothetical protein